MRRGTPITIKSVEERLNSWLKKHASLARQAEALPVRQDMVTLLAFARDNKVVGTQSAGNMPLKAVREVTARFVNPPQLDTQIGEQTFQLRSEEHVWSLYFLHILADVGRLITTGRARRWQITAQAKRFLETEHPLQAAFLLSVWWHKVNWLVAYPYSGLGDALPYFFPQATLASLHSLPTGTDVSFLDYADKLIGNTGLTWTAQDSRFADFLLRGSIERMVIDVLADFDAVKCRYRKEPLGKGTINRLDAIQITPWGKALLDSVIIIGS
jgi:hypothetical protein